MKIFDLTRNHYLDIYDPNDGIYIDHVEHMASFSEGFLSLFKGEQKKDVVALLNNIPVFLAESSMAQEFVAVKNCKCLVEVPADKQLSPMNEFDIDEWLDSKVDEESNDNLLDRPQRGFTIADLLGVYIYSTGKDIIPRRIFIWMDKIVKYAENETKIKDTKTVKKNAQALFDFVLYHEMAHALMDVELYGIHPSPFFSYADDYPYRFYEEAFANGIALKTLMNENLRVTPINSTQQSFIQNFVRTQGDGYSDGWNLYKEANGDYLYNGQWMGMKVLFNKDMALLLRDKWEDIEDRPFLEIFIKSVSRVGRIAVKNHHNKWGIMKLPYLTMSVCYKYDTLESFDENGLCKVKNGNLYGYINEQGDEQIPLEYEVLYRFENGITTVKKDGNYGAIDLNNQTVIPFNLPYEEVREFKNGKAYVKNNQGKWGKIDTEGKEVVLCTKDRPHGLVLNKDSIIHSDKLL